MIDPVENPFKHQSGCSVVISVKQLCALAEMLGPLENSSRAEITGELAMEIDSYFTSATELPRTIPQDANLEDVCIRLGAAFFSEAQHTLMVRIYDVYAEETQYEQQALERPPIVWPFLAPRQAPYRLKRARHGYRCHIAREFVPETICGYVAKVWATDQAFDPRQPPPNICQRCLDLYDEGRDTKRPAGE